jgi:hypothetical protein
METYSIAHNLTSDSSEYIEEKAECSSPSLLTRNLVLLISLFCTYFILVLFGAMNKNSLKG